MFILIDITVFHCMYHYSFRKNKNKAQEGNYRGNWKIKRGGGFGCGRPGLWTTCTSNSKSICSDAQQQLDCIRVESTSPIHYLQLKMQKKKGWPLLLHRLNGAIWHSQKVKRPSHELQPTPADLFLKPKFLLASLT